MDMRMDVLNHEDRQDALLVLQALGARVATYWNVTPGSVAPTYIGRVYCLRPEFEGLVFSSQSETSAADVNLVTIKAACSVAGIKLEEGRYLRRSTCWALAEARIPDRPIVLDQTDFSESQLLSLCYRVLGYVMVASQTTEAKTMRIEPSSETPQFFSLETRFECVRQGDGLLANKAFITDRIDFSMVEHFTPQKGAGNTREMIRKIVYALFSMAGLEVRDNVLYVPASSIHPGAETMTQLLKRGEP